jgi:single-stranded-DNA-specific exonuclease
MNRIAERRRNPSRWIVRPPDPAEDRLRSELGIGRLLAACLVERGFTDPDEAHRFLNPRLEDLHDPLLLPNCSEAVRVLIQAKERGERVFVHGDYDVDGITSTAIWTRSLRRLGFDVVPHVPHRIKHGYGVQEEAVFHAMRQGAKVLLTCDCGSSAYQAVNRAKQLGMRVVVTDHHELGAKTLDADAFVNPHLEGHDYPFPHLSGAGVAFKVAQQVAVELGARAEQFQRAFLDLVCLGTIADVVPLVGENRIFAYYGLKSLEGSKKVGVRALLKVAGIEGAVSSSDVGWRLAPRINAAGRIDDAAKALRLMLTEDEEEAHTIAAELNELNEARRAEEQRILEQALETLAEMDAESLPLLMVWAEEWHRGVVGIVAGRLCEQYNRPVLLASVDAESGVAHGSARAPEIYDLHEALMAKRDLFLSCGGHARAAGFSASVEALEVVRDELVAHAQSVLKAEDLVPTIRATAEMTPEDVNHKSFLELEKLEPYGEANPRPLFLMRNVRFADFQPTSNPEHVRFQVLADRPIFGIGFRSAHLFESLEPGDSVDLLVRASLNRYNGNEYPQVLLEDLRKA